MRQATPKECHSARILIVGGGFSGIGIAIRLRQRGIDDFVILERAADLGGTWRDNRYPGCACDVPSDLYSFSFAPNPEWTRVFSPSAEIWEYLRRCATEYDIDRHFAFGQEVTGAAWDDDAQQWLVTTTTQQWRSSILIAANGPLSDPVIPSLPGLERFRGTAFHSAQWNAGAELRGKRVAVIGTGASAIQIVPRIQPDVSQLTVAQRTPPWIIPRRDGAVSAWRQSLYRAFPVAQRAHRAALYAAREVTFLPFRHQRIARVVELMAKRHLAMQVRDPALRAALTPDYRIGCKRVLLSDDYYPALQEPNVSLVTSPVASFTAHGFVSADGAEHEADVAIFCTGFRATDPPLAAHLIGRDGVSLAHTWQGSPTAYMGTTVSGFPNLFLLLGPNTGLGHNSVMLMVEAQIEHVLGVIALMEARDARSAEPDRDAQARYVAWIDRRLATTVWNRGGCNSWYLDVTGRNSALWPERVGRFRRTVSHIRPADYRFRGNTGAG